MHDYRNADAARPGIPVVRGHFNPSALKRVAAIEPVYPFGCATGLRPGRRSGLGRRSGDSGAWRGLRPGSSQAALGIL